MSPDFRIRFTESDAREDLIESDHEFIEVCGNRHRFEQFQLAISNPAFTTVGRGEITDWSDGRK
ncbi:hypothetical protein [Actinoplanes sp. NPDC049265]|uniref:hypothetical protein n=1 Tax=Actinoplanes sp. NPDC049265 TaxID=3363902 RepID=UPI0037204241